MRLLASASSSISHPEARAGGEMEAPVADGALARGHGVGEQEGCGEAWANPLSSIAWATWPAAAIPTGPSSALDR